MIGCCGLDCEKCDAFIATKRNDDSMRAEVARKWTEAFKAPIKQEHINCTGCMSDGVKFSYCESMCEIRKCAVGKGHATCAECPEFACGTLEAMLKMAPQAREKLESLRAAGGR